MFRRVTILTLTLLAIATSSMAQTSNITKQKQVIADLEKSIAREEQQLKLLIKNKASAEQRIESLAKQIEERNRLIRETTRQIKTLTKEVEASEARLMELGGALNDLEQNAGNIVRSAYRNYRYQNYIAYIFSAPSFAEMTQRVATLRSATIFRQDQIKAVETARSDVQEERENLAKRRAELSETKKRLDGQKSKLQSNINEAKREVSKMSSKHKEVLRTKMEHEEKLNEAIAHLRKLVRGNKAGASFSSKLTGLNIPVVGGRVKRYKGNLAEIGGSEGAAIRSVYEGKVVDIKRNKVDNKYIVYIAHGEYLTTYANLSSVSVSKDAIVKKDQKIGVIAVSVNKISMELEYKIVFGIYAPNPSVTMSAAQCFAK